MSEQAFEERTISSEGVTVTKRFEEDEFPVPAIAFEFESSRDEEVTIRLSDAVPESIAVEDLGFHPEYGSEYWTMDEEQITFERSLSPDAEYTTVYGIRATGSDNIEQFLTEPNLEQVDPPLPEPEEPDGSDDDVVKNALDDEGEIALDDEIPDDADEEEVATLELNEPELSDGESDGKKTEEETTAVAPSDGDSLVAALTAEIQQGSVSNEELAALREALGVEQTGGATVARLDQLQQDISDLRAYTSALEEFLDENGTGQELIEGFDDRLETVTGRVSEMESELDSVKKTVEEEMATVKEDVSRVETEVSAVSDEVQTVDETLEGVTGDIDQVSGELDSVETTLTELEQEVDTLESQVTDEDVEARVDEVADAVSDLQEWQEQLKKTFGGGN